MIGFTVPDLNNSRVYTHDTQMNSYGSRCYCTKLLEISQLWTTSEVSMLIPLGRATNDVALTLRRDAAHSLLFRS